MSLPFLAIMTEVVSRRWECAGVFGCQITDVTCDELTNRPHQMLPLEKEVITKTRHGSSPTPRFPRASSASTAVKAAQGSEKWDRSSPNAMVSNDERCSERRVGNLRGKFQPYRVFLLVATAHNVAQRVWDSGPKCPNYFERVLRG